MPKNGTAVSEKVSEKPMLIKAFRGLVFVLAIFAAVGISAEESRGDLMINERV